jgi:Transposase DDE domain
VQTTEAFRADYAERAGIESAHEQAVRRCSLRQCRYIGLAKTRLQHVVTAVAVNLIRLGEWLAGTPLAPTRRSRFAALQGGYLREARDSPPVSALDLPGYRVLSMSGSTWPRTPGSIPHTRRGARGIVACRRHKPIGAPDETFRG